MRMPSRRSVPGVLPESSDSLAMSSRSSESWKATPNFSPYVAIASATCGVHPEVIAPIRPAAAISEPVLPSSTCR